MPEAPEWNDTIVALATPPGVGAIGVVRLSGPHAMEILDRLAGKPLSEKPSHTLHLTVLKNAGRMMDEAVVGLFKGPKSYTGEDVVEISCHGSPFVLQEVIGACLEAGARLARPGEFTQRAFLHGRLDLAQAEAVADLIAANTSASQWAAIHNMRGGFSNDLKELRDRLIRFSAMIELELDFSQEDVEFADRKEFYELIGELQSTVGALVQSFQLGNVIRNGVSVAIVGRPNAGKSTLLNSLLNEQRAIVSATPGTTRDTIEELLNIDGVLFRLIDTAGISAHSTDMIEAEGIMRSREKMRGAGLVLILFDVNEDEASVREFVATAVEEGMKYLLVANKIDEADENEVRRKYAQLHDVGYISAKGHLYLDELKRRMVDAVVTGKLEGEGTVVTNARHHDALLRVQRSLAEIRAGLDAKISGDLLALDIRRCLHDLGEITGEISSEELLGYIFGRFCIGK